MPKRRHAPQCPPGLVTNALGDVATLVSIASVEGDVYLGGRSPGDGAAEELASVLQVRARRILDFLDELANAVQAGGSPGQPEGGPPDAGSRVADLRRRFVRLHRANLKALREGRRSASHEITSEIHYLLYRHGVELAASIRSSHEPKARPAEAGREEACGGGGGGGGGRFYYEIVEAPIEGF